jgi:hypothetical protein
MKLPNAGLAKVEREKITEYLLNADHPDNGGKAAFFMAGGYRRDDWHALARSFRRIAITYLVTHSIESVHGKKYIIDGAIETPTGKSPTVRTIWFLDSGETIPRFVTAYPQRKIE